MTRAEFESVNCCSTWNSVSEFKQKLEMKMERNLQKFRDPSMWYTSSKPIARIEKQRDTEPGTTTGQMW